MANKFIPWIDEVEPGTTTQEQSVFADDSQRVNGFVAGNPASAIRVNSALRQANVVVAALMQLADELVTLPDLDLNSTVANITAALKASIITPLTTRLTNLENSFEEISGDAASLGQRITTLESEMDAVQSKNTQQDSSISAVDEKVDAHIERADNPHTVTKAQVGLGNVDDVKQYSTSNPPPYPVRSVASKTGAVTLTKSDVGLGNVDNTSDEDKPISTATQNALNGKANTSGSYPNLNVGNATKASADGSGNNIADTYAKKAELPDESELIPSPPNTDDDYILRYKKNAATPMRWSSVATGSLSFVGVAQNSSEFNPSSKGLFGWLIMKDLSSVYISNGTLWGYIYSQYRHRYIPFIGRYLDDNGSTHPICAIYCLAGGDVDSPRIVAYGSDGFSETMYTVNFQWAFLHAINSTYIDL